jgi:hypothetical protein
MLLRHGKVAIECSDTLAGSGR